MKTKRKTQQHTPGPWVAQYDESVPGNAVVMDGQDVLTICQVFDMVKHSEMKANARLIAAAPDMLEACQEALACIMKHVPGTEFAPREMLRAAIAKARGE